MKNMNKQLVVFLLSLLFVYLMQVYTFNNEKIFWYLYTFTLLIGMTISILSAQFKDELSTWKYLIFGIGYGTILYGFVWIQIVCYRGSISLLFFDDLRFNEFVSCHSDFGEIDVGKN